jgi:hypothetical protein
MSGDRITLAVGRNRESMGSIPQPNFRILEFSRV